MINMSALYEHDDYQNALDQFNNSSCKWSFFVDVQLQVAKDKCPICECSLDNSITRLSNGGNSLSIEATIDHYRPQKYYPFLKCEHKNYLLMCSECNNIYKGSQFPLHHSSSIRAIDKTKLVDEKPLIVNPIYDDLLELFILIFRRTSSGKNVLELKPKETTGYLYEKALETIKLFGLGNCEIYRHPNENVYNCRIRILETHFGVFYEFAKALMNGDKRKAFLVLKNNKNLFESYGFLEFLKKEQFIVVV